MLSGRSTRQETSSQRVQPSGCISRVSPTVSGTASRPGTRMAAQIAAWGGEDVDVVPDSRGPGSPASDEGADWEEAAAPSTCVLPPRPAVGF